MAALPNRPKDFGTADRATINGVDVGGGDGSQHINGETSNTNVENIATDIVIVGGGFGVMYATSGVIAGDGSRFVEMASSLLHRLTFSSMPA